MASRLMKRRGGSVAAAKHRREARPLGRRQSEKSSAIPDKERVALIRLVICSSVFVLLVAVKLLLPGKMAGVSQSLSDALERSIDVQAVFSAVGDLFTRDGTPEQAADEVYQAVFHPEAKTEKTAVMTDSDASDILAELQNRQEASDTPAAGETFVETSVATELVLYSDEDLPENVSLQQAILGFDHVTPVKGALSSCFGYREHPTEGEERFHYGVDLAADTGTAIACFADGMVAAVGESSSYGKYCTVNHASGCTTLYAHCSKISVSSGASVKAGETLGEVGETGMATGPHLHFELQKDGIYLNPVYYVETA